MRQQRWSPLNVPLMWGASTEDATPVMEWLVAKTIPIEVPLEFHEGGISPSEAVEFSERSDARLGNSSS